MEEAESQLITREQARALAEEFLDRTEGLPRRSGEDITGVYDLREIRWPHPSLYGVSFDLQDTWIVYVRDESISIQSSTIVVVSKQTGDILYCGSASDEG